MHTITYNEKNYLSSYVYSNKVAGAYIFHNGPKCVYHTYTAPYVCIMAIKSA